MKGLCARIVDPEDAEHISVVGYGYGWNRHIAFDPTESDRLKAVSFALGETSCDAVLAYILAEDEASEQKQNRSSFEQKMADIRRSHAQTMRRLRQEQQKLNEEEILETKKAAARIAVMHQAELTPDALELIQTEVMTENPDLHFPTDDSTEV